MGPRTRAVVGELVLLAGMLAFFVVVMGLVYGVLSLAQSLPLGGLALVLVAMGMNVRGFRPLGECGQVTDPNDYRVLPGSNRR